MFYFVKTPKILRWLYGQCTWEFSKKEKVIYLTFDDGPHPEATPFVLQQLKEWNAKATFFCIGKNVNNYPNLYQKIITDGHVTGNHTQHHLNGWKTTDELYIEDILKAKTKIDSQLFRPPYGRIKKTQVKKLKEQYPGVSIIMWTVLSGDFDPPLSAEKCLTNVTRNSGNGSVVVFHDSAKAFDKLVYALPLVLEYFTKKGYRFEAIRT